MFSDCQPAPHGKLHVLGRSPWTTRYDTGVVTCMAGGAVRVGIGSGVMMR
jgi:hypothetical protein